jgi:hypothetical protein
MTCSYFHHNIWRQKIIPHKNVARETGLGQAFYICRRKCSRTTLPRHSACWQNMVPAFKSLGKQSSLLAALAYVAKKPRRALFARARETGLEPATSAVTGQRSNQIELLPHTLPAFLEARAEHCDCSLKTPIFQPNTLCVGGRTCTFDLGFMSPML